MADTTRDIELRLRASDLSTAELKTVIASVNDLSNSLDKQLAAAARLEVKERELKATLQQLDQAAKNLTGLNALIERAQKLSEQVTKNQADLDKAADALRRHREAMEAGTATGKAAETTLTNFEKRLNNAKTALDQNSATLAKYHADLAAAGVASNQFAATQQQLVTTAAQIGEARTKLNNTIREIPRLEREAKEAARQTVEQQKRDTEAAKAHFATMAAAQEQRKRESDDLRRMLSERIANNRRIASEIAASNADAVKRLRERREAETREARATTDAVRNEFRRRVAQQKADEERAASDAAQRNRPGSTARPGARGMQQTPSFLGLRPYEIQNLGYQINDVISGFASGQNATQILAQQGGQFIQIFGQAALRWLPAVAVAGTAVAVAISAITQEFRRLASDREFAGVLMANTNAVNFNKAALTALRKELQDLGVAWDDAGKIIKQGVEANLRPELLRTYTVAARNIAEVTGKDIVEAMADLVKGTTGGREALENLIAKYPALSQATRDRVRELIGQRREDEAAKVALEGLAETFTKAQKESVSPLTESIRQLKTEWRNFLEVLAETGAFQGIIEFLKNTSREIKGIAGFIGSVTKDFEAAAEYLRTRDPNVLKRRDEERRGEIRHSQGAITTPSATAADEGRAVPMTADVKTFQDNLQAMIADAASKGITIGLGRASRSFEEQTKLWNDALAKYGSAAVARRHVAPPGSSSHEFALANDLRGAGGRAIQPGSPEDRYLRENLARFSMERRMGHEPWHVEPIGARAAIAAGAPRAGSAVQSGPSETQETAAEQQIRTDKERLALVTATSAKKEVEILYEQTLAKAKETTTEEEAKKVAEAAVAVRQYELQVDAIKRAGAEEKQRAQDGVNYNRIQEAGLAARNAAFAKGIVDHKNLQEIQNQGEADERARIQKQQQELDQLESAEKRVADIRRRSLNEHKSNLTALNEATNAFYDEQIKQLDKLAERQSTTDKGRIDKAKADLEELRQADLSRNTRTAAEKQANEALAARQDIIQTLTRLEQAGEITITEKEEKIKEAYGATKTAILEAAAALEQYIATNKNLSETEVMRLTARVKELRAETKYVDPFWKGLKETFSQSFSQGLDTAFNNIAEAIGGAIAKTKEWKDVWSGVKNAALNFFATILRELASYILKAQAAKLASQLFGGGGGFLGNLFGGGASSATGAATTAATTAASTTSTGIFGLGFLGLKKGGVAGRVPPTGIDNPSWWAHAPRYRTGTVVGLAPDEQRAILHRGEEVISADNPRNILNGGGRTGAVNVRAVLIDDKRKIAEAMAGAHGERVIVQTLIRNGATVREIARG